MGLPGQRRSSSHKRRRAAHFALKAKTLTVCAACKKKIPPHRMCPYCGHYAGRKIMATRTEARIAKQARRLKQEKGEDKKKK